MNYRRRIGRRFVNLVIRPLHMIFFLVNTLIFTITAFHWKRWKSDIMVWLSHGLARPYWNRSKRINILYRRLLSNPTSTREFGYKNYKNKLSSTLRAAKRNYFEKKFEECKSNMKSTWRLLNEIINKRKSRNSVQSSFIIDNKEITDSIKITNHFWEFFTNIWPSLAKMIPSSTSSFRSFLSGSVINSISLEAIT